MPNSILINISGDEGVSVRFNVYHEMKDDLLSQVFMSFLEDKSIRSKYLHPYERLLYRVIRRDNNSFVTGPEADACWRVVEDFEMLNSGLLPYRKGSKGPRESVLFLKRDGRKWFV